MKHIFMLIILFKSRLFRDSVTGRAFKDTQRALQHLRHSESTWATGHSESTQRALGHLRHLGTRTFRTLRHLGTWALKALRHSGTQTLGHSGTWGLIALRHLGTWTLKALTHSDTWALEALYLADSKNADFYLSRKQFVVLLDKG